SVVNGVLLNPLPYPHADRIVTLFDEYPQFKTGSISYPNFLDWRHMNRSFSAMAAYRVQAYILSGSGQPEHLQGEMISAGFFDILGVKPILGRTFNKKDDRLGTAPVAILSEGLWRRKFGAAPDIIGKRLVIDGAGRTVIGVVPSTFRLRIKNFQKGGPLNNFQGGAQLNEIYTPIGQFNQPQFYASRDSGWGMDAIGRLKHGVTFVQACEDMERVSRQLAAIYPGIDSHQKANLAPLKKEIVGDMRPVLLLLLGAVSFVLLIACVNVANLLLARSTGRQREFAIRLAVGAGRARIVRQLLTESILLALIGGGLGLLIAKFGTAAALAAVPQTVPRAGSIGLDVYVLLFTIFVSAATGIIFGLAPAWKLRYANIGGALKESGRNFAGTRGRTQRVFVVVEMALALVLLIGAGLTIRTLFALWDADPGFHPRGVLTFSVAQQPSLAKESPAAIRAFYEQLHNQLASTPGVDAVSLSWGSTPMGRDNEQYFWFVGKPKPAQTDDLPMALRYRVEPSYLKIMQISLKRGRFFTSRDDKNTPPVAVIDESLAKKYFPGQDPVGRYLVVNLYPSAQPNARIVGVVAHVNQWGLALDAASPLHAQIYSPIAQFPDDLVRHDAGGANVFVRGKG
ncbi:MAG: ABC transporter permease, partial [Bryobacteraceae bacterium]